MVTIDPIHGGTGEWQAISTGAARRHQRRARVLTAAAAGLLGMLTGCAGGLSEFASGSPTVSQPVRRIEYTGPRIPVAVGSVANRTGVTEQREGTGTTIQTGAAAAPPDKKLTVRDPIGDGMRDQLITALTQTGVCSVMHRADGQSPLGNATSSGARYLIEGAVTEYEPSQASAAGGYGWGMQRRAPVSDPTVSSGNVFSQVLAPNAIGGMFEQDHIAINVHLIDVHSGAVVASTRIEAKPKDLGVAMNLLMPGRRTNSMIDGGGQWKTPMQQAIGACMAKAAHWASQEILRQEPASPSPSSATSMGGATATRAKQS